MRAHWTLLLWCGLACAAPAPAVLAQSSGTPVPGAAGPNPGAAATDAINNPTRPPAGVTPPPGATTPGQVQYSPPPVVDPAAAQPQGALTSAEIRELLDAAQATAKATRESVDYTRVMPDILTQILAKLDKLENKLDKIEDVLRAPPPRRR
ncbi:hypothetical protein [uncultured Enterovirga sp.]|uniref:hypothetical protein n=1 Tax=uncultured Enterovirga sp. TaxID=2026352 RepID=UPI0035CA8E2E